MANVPWKATKTNSSSPETKTSRGPWKMSFPFGPPKGFLAGAFLVFLVFFWGGECNINSENHTLEKMSPNS